MRGEIASQADIEAVFQRPLARATQFPAANNSAGTASGSIPFHPYLKHAYGRACHLLVSFRRSPVCVGRTFSQY
jgi:hypothetical protein